MTEPVNVRSHRTSCNDSAGAAVIAVTVSCSARDALSCLDSSDSVVSARRLSKASSAAACAATAAWYGERVVSDARRLSASSSEANSAAERLRTISIVRAGVPSSIWAANIHWVDTHLSMASSHVTCDKYCD